MDALSSASLEEIEAVHGIGPTIAAAVHEYFSDAAMRKLIARLGHHELRFDEPSRTVSSSALQGLTVVITGTLPTLSRGEARERIQSAGGKVTDSVSKATGLVVVGADAGSKLDRARALHIETIDETELLKRLGR